jgi:hypothetical protein
MAVANPRPTGRQLGVFVGPNTSQLRLVRPILEIEYAALSGSIEQLNSVSQDLSLYQLVQLNYDSYRAALAHHTNEYAKRPPANSYAMDPIYNDLIRHLLNLLFVSRTFLDHTGTKLAKKYGKESDKLKLFKAKCSEEYDSTFAYRFLYDLRNFAQHCEIPVGFSASAHKRAPGAPWTDVQFRFVIDRDPLLRSFKWKPRLRSEIAGLQESFDIDPLVDRFVESLGRIRVALVSNNWQEVVSGVKRLRALVMEVKEGEPVIVEMVPRPDNPGKVKLQVEWLPLHLITAFDLVNQAHH